MEKKASRAVQPSAKGPTEAKKTPDNAGGKQWPRNSRRREPTNGTFANKNEPSRTSQRGKGHFSKQPRARGLLDNSRREEPGLDTFEPEHGSVLAKGSKKQSLNHLLNFQLAPHVAGPRGLSNSHKYGGRWNSSCKHKYNKEQFLQANCQFVVKSSGDYRLYMNNPDALVDWDLVEQVNIQVVERPLCPICLYPPVSAKMTRCGHIYCWSCVLHYLTLSEKSWSKCPICFEAIHKQDLKSVVTLLKTSHEINRTITFTLMKKMLGSLIAYPASENITPKETPLTLSEDKTNIYSKLLTATIEDVLNLIERERIELTVQMSDEDNAPEKCFIEQALTLLSERENFVLARTINTENNEVISVKNENDTNKTDDNLELVQQQMKQLNVTDSCNNLTRDRFESTSSENLGSETSNSFSETAFDNTNSLLENINSTPVEIRNAVKHYYFYQASDGQHVYMHSMNVKMLEHTYGSLECCPTTITGRILEKEPVSMTEEVRNRNRYLRHLPVTCQFEMVEIELAQPVISRETVEFFQEQVSQRVRRRLKRAREEKRREKRITEEENRKIGKFPDVNLKLESHYQFPDFSSHDPMPGGSREDDSSSVEEVLSTTPKERSFAQMLASKTTAAPSWPQLSSNRTSSNAAPVKLINVTGSALKAPVYRRMHGNSESEPECEDYVPAPSFNTTFKDSLAVALEKAANSFENTGGSVNNGNGRKKKKKNKQQLLFSTNMPIDRA